MSALEVCLSSIGITTREVRAHPTRWHSAFVVVRSGHAILAVRDTCGDQSQEILLDAVGCRHLATLLTECAEEIEAKRPDDVMDRMRAVETEHLAHLRKPTALDAILIIVGIVATFLFLVNVFVLEADGWLVWATLCFILVSVVDYVGAIRRAVAWRARHAGDAS